MDEFEKLKKRLTEAADLVKIFPESLHQRVFDTVMRGALEAAPPEKTDAQAGRPQQRSGAAPREETPSKARGPKSAKGAKHRLPHRVVDLELGHKSQSDSFDHLYAEKKPRTAYEFNALAVYYLSERKNLEAISIDHVFTCYDHVNRRAPTVLAQSLRDTERDKGYIQASDLDNLRLMPKGRNLVLHDLPASASTDET